MLKKVVVAMMFLLISSFGVLAQAFESITVKAPMPPQEGEKFLTEFCKGKQKTILIKRQAYRGCLLKFKEGGTPLSGVVSSEGFDLSLRRVLLSHGPQKTEWLVGNFPSDQLSALHFYVLPLNKT